jgi:hypothetical protein
MFFFSDVLEMVLAPIESMTKKVQNMANNPMMALQEAERLEFVNALMGDQKKGCCAKKKKTEPLETEILEKTISKIGALLVLGFGEAGSEIIAKNLSNDNGKYFKLKYLILSFIYLRIIVNLFFILKNIVLNSN